MYDNQTNLFNKFTEMTGEFVRQSLADDIKQHIPGRLAHRGLDTINIIIDLRISKLTAAAVIIITMILLANFFGGVNLAQEWLYKDNRLLVNYLFKGDRFTSDENVTAGFLKYYQDLERQGKEVVYYGDSIDLADSNNIIIQWKLSDGNYRVIYSDLRIETVSGDKLIKLQARMLQKKK